MSDIGCPGCAEKNAYIERLQRNVTSANLRNASQIAHIQMITDMRDSWLPWWFRQSLFKFMRKHFPLTRPFLREYHIEQYLSAQTQEQIYRARKENQRIAKEERKANNRPLNESRTTVKRRVMRRAVEEIGKLDSLSRKEEEGEK